MVEFSNPPGVAAPIGQYTHVALVKAGSDLLYISGQVGTDPSGNAGKTIEQQADYALANIVAILKANGLTTANLVKMMTFVTDRSHREAVNAARKKHLGDAKPASTFLIVAGLARPELMVEIEAVAARP